MPQVTPIVIPDAQATPVNHTFIPLGPDNSGVWHYEDQSGGIPAGFQRASLSLKRATSPAIGKASIGINRVRLTLSLPRLESVPPAPGFAARMTVSHAPRVTVEFIIPELATLQDRKDIRKYLTGLLGDTQLVAAVEQLQNVY